MKLMDQISARVRARRVVENLLLVESRKREQRPGPVDTRLVRVLMSWFSDRWVT